jgi:hypothetical protein
MYAAEFVASYLGSPFSFVKSVRLGVCIAIISFLSMCITGLIARRKRALQSQTAAVLSGWYCFSLLTAILIASGRIDLIDPSLGNAKQSRYLLNPLLTWSAVLLGSAWACWQLTRRALAGYTITAIAAVLIFTGFHQLQPWLMQQDKPYINVQLAGLAVEMNIFDPGVMLNLFPWNPSYVEQCAPILRRDHLSLYYKGYGNWLGHGLNEFAKLVNAPVHGAITYTYRVLGGVEVGGWADDSQVFGAKHWILLSSDTGQIVGFGRRLPAGFPEALDNIATPLSLGWAGFVSLKYPVREIAAYVVTRRGLVPLTRPMPAPQLAVASAQETGPPLPGIQWERDPSWTPGEPPPYVPYGSAPSGPIYNSWSGSDANTGRIWSSSFSAPSDGCLIVPVLQGYHSDGLSAEVIDADTNQVIASIPFQNAPKQWTFWRIPVPTQAKHLRIRAQDDGRNWGEWLALGTPASCRTP